MKCIVTGVAGFIGSHLAERLLTDGHNVVGIDCFTDYYQSSLKEDNIKGLLKNGNFKLIKADLLTAELNKLLTGIDIVFHEAAQPGVRASWGKDFEIYANNNILATQRLLEAVKETPIKKFIFASSSSVYGNLNELPVRETMRPQPVSPYSVTKLAAENLCMLYHTNYKVPVICLRYFTVYGPRQRPDMAFNRFINATLNDKEVIIYGDGSQTRDFTYISDAVEANILAMKSIAAGEIFNISGGSTIKIADVLQILNELSKNINIRYESSQKGDVDHTAADISKARKMLGYAPKIKIVEGLKKEFEWLKDLKINA